jgi:8-oxo-dGTP pyrophosphatase MutT (NUDIX family)
MLGFLSDAIPPGLAGMLNDGPPVTPRPAATVVLTRGDRPWEMLMMRRPGGADFAPGAHVFPGGSVHPEDRMLGDASRGCAVRELFEELGVLLARRGDRHATRAEAERLRLRLAHGVNFPTALKEAGLTADLDGLTYFARWVTPEALRRRFDTRFYLARLPAGQEIVAQPGEVDAWLWVDPESALADPGFTLVFATRKVIEGIARERDADALRRRYAERKRIRIVRPVVRVEGGRIEVVKRVREAGRRAHGSPRR